MYNIIYNRKYGKYMNIENGNIENIEKWKGQANIEEQSKMEKNTFKQYEDKDPKYWNIKNMENVETLL